MSIFERLRMRSCVKPDRAARPFAVVSYITCYAIQYYTIRTLHCKDIIATIFQRQTLTRLIQKDSSADRAAEQCDQQDEDVEKRKLLARIRRRASSPGYSFGEIARAIRISLQMTRHEFAQYCGISVSAIHDLERNRGNQTVSTLNRVGKLAGLNLRFMPESAMRRPAIPLMDFVDGLREASNKLEQRRKERISMSRGLGHRNEVLKQISDLRQQAARRIEKQGGGSEGKEKKDENQGGNCRNKKEN